MFELVRIQASNIKAQNCSASLIQSILKFSQNTMRETGVIVGQESRIQLISEAFFTPVVLPTVMTGQTLIPYTGFFPGDQRKTLQL